MGRLPSSGRKVRLCHKFRMKWDGPDQSQTFHIAIPMAYSRRYVRGFLEASLRSESMKREKRPLPGAVLRFVLFVPEGWSTDPSWDADKLTFDMPSCATLPSIAYLLVLQVVDSLCQLSQSTGLDRVFPLLEVHYCALGNSGLATETSSRKLLR